MGGAAAIGGMRGQQVETFSLHSTCVSTATLVSLRRHEVVWEVRTCPNGASRAPGETELALWHSGNPNSSFACDDIGFG